MFVITQFYCDIGFSFFSISAGTFQNSSSPNKSAVSEKSNTVSFLPPRFPAANLSVKTFGFLLNPVRCPPRTVPSFAKYITSFFFEIAPKSLFPFDFVIVTRKPLCPFPRDLSSGDLLSPPFTHYTNCVILNYRKSELSLVSDVRHTGFLGTAAASDKLFLFVTLNNSYL